MIEDTRTPGDRIAQLSTLQAQGAITADEFSLLKARIIEEQLGKQPQETQTAQQEVTPAAPVQKAHGSWMPPVIGIIAVLAISIVAAIFFASDTDLVSAVKRQENGTHIVVLTSKKANLNVTGITINRGNCDAYSFPIRLPKILDFGDQIRLVASCDPIEMNVGSDRGVTTITWK